jgi:hypothetical protein
VTWELHHHDARRVSDIIAPESVDLIVTSPPYFALRSYRDSGEHYDGQHRRRPIPRLPASRRVALLERHPSQGQGARPVWHPQPGTTRHRRPDEPVWGGRRVTVALDHYCATPLVDAARELYHLCRLHPGHTGEHRCAFCPHQWNEPRTER